jgi:fructuronate reductase
MPGRRNIANTEVNPAVELPEYDRSALKSRIVHIGFGAFHRAHQAVYTHEVATRTGGDWGILAVDIFPGPHIDALKAQDCRYTVLEMGADGSRARQIGIHTGALVVSEDGVEVVLARMSDPDVAIVSLTVTEKGYCMDLATRQLQLDNALIQKDRAHPDAPASAPGLIVAALKRRRDAGIRPFSVMSCDNCPENGHVARAAVLGLARLLDPELADWISGHVTFPCTMVDRIVPAVTPETLGQIEAAVGVADPCGVASEPFRQWVIEDNFVNGRPEWELAGAEPVGDVIPFEEMKLRMLNGSHSFLAYLGYLGGYDHISDCMQDPAYKKAARDLMLMEQAPTLSVPGSVDLAAYADRLIDRFENPALKHRTWQIAMDGSQKLPQRMLHAISWHLDRGNAFPHLAMGVAGWMRYVAGIDEQGAPIDVRDPLAARFAEINTTCKGEARLRALMGLESVFEPRLAENPVFVEAITGAYETLVAVGARKAVAGL